MNDPVLGIDLGGSSIKAGAVVPATGELFGELESVPTPQPATPAAVEAALAGLASRIPAARGPVGFAFPAVVTQGRARTAANVDRAWIGTDGAALVARATGRAAWFLNDADAAGLAEMRLGAGRGERGTVLMLTFGTGIGSALFVDGRLWPNTELGHLQLPDALGEAELHASARVRAERGLGFEAWAQRVNLVLAEFQRLLWPDVIVVGGGVSERWEEFAPHLRSEARLVPARLRQNAGVVGAALYALESHAAGR
ncbi:MAG: ROK family protein [Steroidobacteraceae bacterium]|jgi:polyphosphate glucokinase|nr:ROK family protein [Steroidobacteraceae bacterium]